MWVETQDGVLVNLSNGSCVYLGDRKDGWNVLFDDRKDGWNGFFDVANRHRQYVLGRYKAEKNAREMLDAFKQKLRRSGEKIFKFKEEAEENDVAD